jgi:Sortilin, neurotensin receptor 3,
MTKRRILPLVLCLLPFTLSLQAQIDPELLAGMKARAIGPAAMSGRVAAIDAVESDPDIVYVGAATGGVWKSTDGAYSFTPVFDEQPVAAIGAVAVNQTSPEIVWVGTGEGNPRNSVSVGNGIYKSLDGGTTWQHLGLEKTERIHRIVLHPRDPNVAWVAAMGQAWGQNADRGVFKTTDGGRTWTKVLYVNERTGAADLVIDPENPNKLFAAMWEFQRWPWFFNSGGPGSGLHVTYDGGTTWKRFTEEDGMPKGALGRIGLGIARSNPSVVYALVEADKSALLRSCVATLPLAQYYHVALDDETLYNVYGGMQDNGSWKGPNTTWETGGIRNSDWQEVGFGDGFATMPIPTDSMTGYAMSQEGYLVRWNLRTGERKDIRPSAPQGRALRFNWNAAIAIDPFDPNTVYYGSQ